MDCCHKGLLSGMVVKSWLLTNKKKFFLKVLLSKTTILKSAKIVYGAYQISIQIEPKHCRF